MNKNESFVRKIPLAIKALYLSWICTIFIIFGPWVLFQNWIYGRQMIMTSEGCITAGIGGLIIGFPLSIPLDFMISDIDIKLGNITFLNKVYFLKPCSLYPSLLFNILELFLGYCFWFKWFPAIIKFSIFEIKILYKKLKNESN